MYIYSFIKNILVCASLLFLPCLMSGCTEDDAREGESLSQEEKRPDADVLSVLGVKSDSERAGNIQEEQNKSALPVTIHSPDFDKEKEQTEIYTPRAAKSPLDF